MAQNFTNILYTASSCYKSEKLGSVTQEYICFLHACATKPSNISTLTMPKISREKNSKCKQRYDISIIKSLCCTELPLMFRSLPAGHRARFLPLRPGGPGPQYPVPARLVHPATQGRTVKDYFFVFGCFFSCCIRVDYEIWILTYSHVIKAYSVLKGKNSRSHLSEFLLFCVSTCRVYSFYVLQYENTYYNGPPA